MREKGPTSRSTRTYNSYDIAQGIERERKRHHLSATTMAPPPPRRHPLKSSFSLSLVSSPHLWNSFFYNILHSRHPCILAILRLVWWLRLVQYRMRHSTPRSLSEKKEKKKKRSFLFSISRLFLALSPVRFLALYPSCLFSRLSSDMCTHIYISSRLLLRVEMDQIIGKSKIERRKEVHEELARRRYPYYLYLHILPAKINSSRGYRQTRTSESLLMSCSNDRVEIYIRKNEMYNEVVAVVYYVKNVYHSLGAIEHT
jgi:hypothetical protein